MGMNWERRALPGMGMNWERRALPGMGMNWERRALPGMGMKSQAEPGGPSDHDPMSVAVRWSVGTARR